MDTNENRLSPEMYQKLCKVYNQYMIEKKESLDRFNKFAKEIISDKEYSDGGDILEFIEPITDNHERRLHDPSIFKLRGRQVLQTFFDEPYPVMMPEDVNRMTGATNGRIWKKEAMRNLPNNRTHLTVPRGRKSWLWLKLLEMQHAPVVLYEPPSTKVELKSVIHMRWPKPDLSDIKAVDFRYGKLHRYRGGG